LIKGPFAFLILADESATWKIAGLTQLDRLVLALNEFAETIEPGAVIDAFIFWRPDIPSSTRWLPRHPKVNRLRLSESIKSIQNPVQVLDTHLFVYRHGLAEFFQRVSVPKVDPPISDDDESWAKLRESSKAVFESRLPGNTQLVWRHLGKFEDIQASEKAFARHLGKPQDGIVSRLINRPISRTVTRFLLRYEITPAAWTLSMLVLPIASYFVMLRGDYIAFLLGVAIFQIYSILDGCDGEIARAKYLESEKGGMLDTWTDIFGGFIFILGLGAGLYRKHVAETNALYYVYQAIACVLLIGVNEWRLRGRKAQIESSSNALIPTLYPRHQELIHHSGILLLGEKLVSWLVQFTKRDISIFVFFLLAVVSRPEWILPLWIVATAAVFVLAETARRKGALSSLPNSSDD
jgi:phosphatidylglycerophosphate synthase